MCKKAVAGGQLKDRGIGCFSQTGGRTAFKECTFGEAMAARVPSKGTNIYVVSDPTIDSQKRMMKAVEGLGMPRLKSPFEHGNLFVVMHIEFPTCLSTEAQVAVAKLLPPPKNQTSVAKDKPSDAEEVRPVLCSYATCVRANHHAQLAS